MKKNRFLPISKNDLHARGWKELDVILITGDAYIDHPSFGAALLGRFLESKGYKVGIIAQPDWKSNEDFMRLGRPRICFGITSGNMDSMINHYTAQRKIRSQDAYSPAGKSGLRPNRATIIYTQKIKTVYKEVPIIIGGIEASLRRIPQYDYWSDKVRNSILFDSKADLLLYGMAERSLLDACRYIEEKGSLTGLDNLQGSVCITKKKSSETFEMLPEYSKNFTKEDFYRMSQIFFRYANQKTIYQEFSGRYLKHNKPCKALTTVEMDEIYSLPFQRKPHPIYNGKTIKAYEQIKTSITSHRGCFGGCNFCAIGLHQGKKIQSRSEKSIIEEVRKISSDEKFNGTISDIGGPTANMYGMYCSIGIEATCPRRSCLYPEICPKLSTSHRDLKKMLSDAISLKSVNHLFVASGVRFDLAILDDSYIDILAQKYTGGLVKLAPEHTEDSVLQYMNKPSFAKYEKFHKKFSQFSKKAGKKQFIVPYVIVGHPGAKIQDTIEMAVYLKKHDIRLKQIQEFTPTPMSVSTMMYYTGKDMEGNKINIPKGRELKLQKALIQWFLPANRKYVLEAIKLAGRLDLRSFFFR